MSFEVKDSGERSEFASGMVRDTARDKVDYELVFSGPLIERLAKHLTLGSKKYTRNNWLKASGKEELERFKQSAVRHFVQWLRGDQDEDHFAAVVFNLNGAEFVKEKLNGQQRELEFPGARIDSIRIDSAYSAANASEARDSAEVPSSGLEQTYTARAGIRPGDR